MRLGTHSSRRDVQGICASSVHGIWYRRQLPRSDTSPLLLSICWFLASNVVLWEFFFIIIWPPPHFLLMLSLCANVRAVNAGWWQFRRCCRCCLQSMALFAASLILLSPSLIVVCLQKILRVWSSYCLSVETRAPQCAKTVHAFEHFFAHYLCTLFAHFCAHFCTLFAHFCTLFIVCTCTVFCTLLRFNVHTFVHVLPKYQSSRWGKCGRCYFPHV